MPLPRPPAALTRPDGVVWLRRAAVALLVLGLLSCAASAGDSPADPTLLPPGETQGPVVASTERVALPGFGDVVVQVTRVDGEVVSWCLLLADTPELRQQGLMTVSDAELGGYDGMLFRFDQVTTSAFWMRNTPQQLSLAYVAEDGSLVSTVQMEPCGDSGECPDYPPSGPYRWAIEVPTAVGGVAALGFEPGAAFRDLGQPCSDSDGR